MSSSIDRAVHEREGAERHVRALYFSLLKAWDARDARAFASLFAPEGSIVGFDGSMVDGAANIETHLAEIFGRHQTPAYVAKVRELRVLGPGVCLLRAVAGMVPAGQSALNPVLNAVQSLLAVRTEGAWRIVLLQNTPAQFHGRPDDVRTLTEELDRVRREAS